MSEELIGESWETVDNIKIYQDDFEKDCKDILDNSYIGPGDLFAYYGIVRHYKPKKIVEIGVGFSTEAAYYAMKRYQEPNIIAIDQVQNRISDKIKVKGIPDIWQDIDFESIITALEEGDILFIDNGHGKKDFDDIKDKIFPLTKRGVLVHFHDIENRSADIAHRHQESKELNGFIRNNPNYFKVVLFMNLLTNSYRKEMKDKIRFCEREYGSIWLIKQ